MWTRCHHRVGQINRSVNQSINHISRGSRQQNTTATRHDTTYDTNNVVCGGRAGWMREREKTEKKRMQPPSSTVLAMTKPPKRPPKRPLDWAQHEAKSPIPPRKPRPHAIPGGPAWNPTPDSALYTTHCITKKKK